MKAKTKSWKQIEKKLFTREEVAEAERFAEREILEMNLRELRQAAGKTQEQLEVGFGPGLAVALAAELASRGKVVGVDHSELMLRQARRRNGRAIAAGRVELQLGSADDSTGWVRTSCSWWRSM